MSGNFWVFIALLSSCTQYNFLKLIHIVKDLKIKVYNENVSSTLVLCVVIHCLVYLDPRRNDLIWNFRENSLFIVYLYFQISHIFFYLNLISSSHED